MHPPTLAGARGALALGLLLLAALAVAGCGGGDDGGAGPEAARPNGTATAREATLEQIQRDPREWNEGPVVVRGEAYPRPGGFVLVNDAVAMWVAAPAGTPGVSAGDSVRVRGEVERLGEDDAAQVAQALRLEHDPGLPLTALRVIAKTPAEIGEPFIVLRTLGGAAGS